MKIKNIIKIIYNAIRFGVRKNVKIGKHCLAASSTKIMVDNSGVVSIGSGMCTNRNTTIHSNGGKISVGDNFFVNEGSIIVSQEKIEIGDNCKIGPGVYIYDHDHNINSHNEYKTSPVVIGNNVWIGAGAIILRGTHIGDNCVIGAGTIIKDKIEDNTLIYSERKISNKRIETNK